MFGSFRHGNTEMDENAALGILQHLDSQTLQQLLDDDTKLEDLITDLQQVKNLGVEKENLIASNKSLADYNLSREPQFTQLKSQLSDLYTRGIDVQKKYEEGKQKLDFHASQQSLDTTLALMQTETAKAEEDSETIADSFLGGDLEIDDFLQQFLDTRKIGHLRRVKAEKMAEIIQNQNAAHRHPTPAQPAYGGGAVNSWNNAPYPTGNFGMPDPTAYLPR